MGGGSTRASNLVNSMSKKGYKITVITCFPHYPYGKIPKEYHNKIISIEYMNSVQIIRVFTPPLPSEGILYRMLLFISFTFAPLLAFAYIKDINYVWAANPNIVSFFPAKFYGFLKRSPVILNIDDLWPDVPIQIGMIKSTTMIYLLKIITKFVYRASDAFTPISPQYRDEIIDKYYVNPNKIEVIPGGVDINIFKNQKIIKNDVYTVMYIGAFSPTYDFDSIFKAAKILENNNDIKIVLQGAGELYNWIYKLKKELNTDNIEIVNKIVSREKVAQLLTSADALLLPLGHSQHVQMGISTKLYEYQAAGKPIICFAKGMQADYVKKTGCGVILEPGDYIGLAKSIKYLKENSSVANQYGLNGKNYIINTMTLEALSEKFSKLLNKLKTNS
jgi:glycosyltransferase involved in cell wall biosynthesis